MLRGIHHIGIAVRQADGALGFYRDLLGLQVTKDAVLEEQGIRGVLLAAGETEIELLQPLHPETTVGRFLEGRGEGLHHLCFRSDDVAGDLEDARRRGLRLIDERPRPGLAGMIGFVHPSATHGVLVEFAQPPETDLAARETPSGELTARAFDHVAVAVSDVDAGAQAFRDNFRLHEDSRADLTHLGIRVASFSLGEAFIGVIAPLSAETAVARFLQRRGEGLYLLSISVRDLDRALEALHRRGVRVGEVVDGGTGARFAIVPPSAANGVLLQLIERRESSVG